MFHLLCRLLTPVPRSIILRSSQPYGMAQVSQGKIRILRCTTVRYTQLSLGDRDFVIIGSLVQTVLPHICFLFISSQLWSTLPSDPVSQLRPCASLVLRIASWTGTLTHKIRTMPGTPKNLRQSRRLERTAKSGLVR